MAIAILTLFILALAHFVLEGIVFPSARSEIRMKLFSIRDELRNTQIQKNEMVTVDQFKYLDGIINKILSSMSSINFIMLYDGLKHIASDKKVTSKIDKKIGVINEDSSWTIRNLRDVTVEYTFYIMAVNSGAWIIYLSPLILIYFILKHSNAFVKMVRTKILTFLTVSDKFVQNDDALSFGIA